MRKANRIMMVTVSVLLTLTLISTCLISGLYAKYITKEDSLVTVTFKAFGVTVTATPGTSLSSEVGTSQVTAAENALTYEFTGIKIKPGDDFSDAIRFTITGTAEVPVEVRIVCHIAFSSANYFAVPAGLGNVSSGDGDAASKRRVPLGFTFGGLYYNENTQTYTRVLNNDYAAVPWTTYAADNQEKYFAQGIRDKIDAIAFATDDDYVYKRFNPTEPIVFYADTDTAKNNPINAVELGFVWPATWPVGGSQIDIDKYDEMSTYLSDYLSTLKVDDKDYAVKVKYTVLIEQMSPQNQ